LLGRFLKTTTCVEYGKNAFVQNAINAAKAKNDFLPHFWVNALLTVKLLPHYK